MRNKHSAAGLALLAFLSFCTAVPALLAYGQSYTNISAAINSTAQYVNRVNQSSYLIFYPNLTQAYGYIKTARNESQINVPYAYSLLTKARLSAGEQQRLMSRYQSISTYVLAAISALLAIVLYSYMRPYGRKPGGNSK